MPGKEQRACARRPKEFAVIPTSDIVLLELERYQPSADEKKLRFGLAADEKPPQQQTFWTLRELKVDGETIPMNVRGRSPNNAYLQFSEHGCDAHRSVPEGNGRESVLIPYGSRFWQYVLGAASQPKAITFRATPPMTLELQGIFKFEDDRLTIAYHKGAPRPEKFESAAGSGITLMVLQASALRGRGGRIALPPSANATSGGRGPRGAGGFDGGAANVSPPTVRVTQPVVCNVSDYEEYTGRIEKGNVPLAIPAKGRIVFLPREDGQTVFGRTVKEGDAILESVPDNEWPALELKLSPKLKHLDSAQRRVEKILPLIPTFAQGENDAIVQAALRDRKLAFEDLNTALANVKAAKVLAPCSGVVLRQEIPDLGEGAQIASIKPTDATLVSFDVPDRTVLAHRRMPNYKAGWERTLPVVSALADEKGFPHRGKVVSVAETIDPTTHTQRWQAIVPNKDSIFMPGMSVRVRVITSEPHKVMLVPWHAYINDDIGRVFLVNDRNVVEARRITHGGHYDDFLEVLEGASATDWIVAQPYVDDIRIGAAVKPERVTTPPPPWSSQQSAPPVRAGDSPETTMEALER